MKSKPRSTLDLSIELPQKKSKCTKVNTVAKKLMLKKHQKQATEKGICIDLDKYVSSTKDVNVWISNKKFTLLEQDRDILLNPTGWLNTSIISTAQILSKAEYRTTGQVILSVNGSQ